MRGTRRVSWHPGRGGLAVLLVGASLGAAAPVGADEPPGDGPADVLGECVDAAVVALGAGGATPTSEPYRDFLTEGQSRSRPFVFEASECVGFLAVGHRRVHDLDLSLMTGRGVLLERDANVDARPYVRFCGAAGLHLVVNLEMYKGQGEVALIAFRDAPVQLPDLGRTVGACFATSGGIRRPSAQVGAAPPGRSVDDAGVAMAERLARLGYSPDGPAQTGQLSQGLREARRLLLEGGRCYAIALVGGAEVGDVDLFVRTLNGLEVGRDESRRNDAVVRLCPPESGELVADVRMFAGRGDYTLRTYVLPDVSGTPPGVEGNARGRWAEVRARLAARGLSPRPLPWGMLIPGQTLWIPIDLEAGRCYGLSAVTADEAAEGDLDLMLVDERGALLAWDVGANASPVLYHCPEESGRYRIRGRLYGAWGRYLTVLGEEPAREPR